MDNLTHSLVGALLGQAGLKRRTGLAMPALIIGANLPDVDVSCFLWLDGVEHLGFRRGITHGPIAWLLLPLVLSGILWGYDRWQARRGKRPEARLPVSFKWLFALSFIACLTHPALDWLNNYGIRLLEPFSSRWFYGDTLFIIDVWLWAGLGFATWFSLRRERAGREYAAIAVSALGLAVCYVAVNLGISTLNRWSNPSHETVIPLEVPLAFWQREQLIDLGDGRWLLGQQELGTVPLSHCDLAAIRQSDRQVDAFLTWSRSPYVEQIADGWLLRDARFAVRGAFSVTLPESSCRA